MLKFHLLDWFFVVFHSALMLFNMLGWMLKILRKWNLFTLLLTAFSWFFLGLFYGIGYCFLTNWHWEILNEISTYPQESSYVQYLFRRLLGIVVSADFADFLTVTVFILALCVSIILNVRDFSKKQKEKRAMKKV